MENFNEAKYNKARKKVKEVKDFYIHLTVYIVVNICLLIMHLGIFQSGVLDVNVPTWSMFTTPFFWGIGLFFHALHVFKDSFKIFRDWEERKIKEFMDKENEDIKNNFS